MDFSPKKGSDWAPGYHHLLYNLTDEAIRACPPSTEWVITTNGDNDYASTLLSTLLEAPQDSDIVALDYYSRYQRPTAAPCHRFQQESDKPHCKRNKYAPHSLNLHTSLSVLTSCLTYDCASQAQASPCAACVGQYVLSMPAVCKQICKPHCKLACTHAQPTTTKATGSFRPCLHSGALVRQTGVMHHRSIHCSTHFKLCAGCLGATQTLEPTYCAGPAL